MGFVGFSVVDLDTVYLCRAGVLSSHAGKGIYRKLIGVGLRHYRKLGYARCVTDCTAPNVGSARGLMASGFKPFWPISPWALKDSIYWEKAL